MLVQKNRVDNQSFPVPGFDFILLTVYAFIVSCEQNCLMNRRSVSVVAAMQDGESRSGQSDAPPGRLLREPTARHGRPAVSPRRMCVVTAGGSLRAPPPSLPRSASSDLLQSASLVWFSLGEPTLVLS